MKNRFFAIKSSVKQSLRTIPAREYLASYFGCLRVATIVLRDPHIVQMGRLLGTTAVWSHPAASSSAPVLGSDQTATRQPGCLYPLIRFTFNNLTGHVVFFSPRLAMVAT